MQACGATSPDETLHERMVSGTGELPLMDILAALPRHLVLGLEVPQRSLAEVGVETHERVARCVAGTRNLLQQVTVHAAASKPAARNAGI